MRLGNLRRDEKLSESRVDVTQSELCMRCAWYPTWWTRLEMDGINLSTGNSRGSRRHTGIVRHQVQ
jgi:hypothetical protein